NKLPIHDIIQKRPIGGDSGDTKDLETVVTPSLLLDLDQLEKNIQDIMEVANSYGVHYRPHVKTHKSVEIARRQIKAGAIGLTVAKVGEAEVMADAGVKDILI